VALGFTLISAISLIAGDIDSPENATNSVVWELTPLSETRTKRPADTKKASKRPSLPVSPVETSSGHKKGSIPNVVSYRTRRPQEAPTVISRSSKTGTTGWAKSTATNPSKLPYIRPGQQAVVARVVRRRRINSMPAKAPRAMVAAKANDEIPQFELKPLDDTEFRRTLADRQPELSNAPHAVVSTVVAVKSTQTRRQVFDAAAFEQPVPSVNPGDHVQAGVAPIETVPIQEDEPVGFVTLQLQPLSDNPNDYEEAREDKEATGFDAEEVTDTATRLVGSTRPEMPQLDFVPINQVDLIAAVRTPQQENPKYTEPVDLAAIINDQYAPIQNWGAPQWYTFKPNRNTFPFRHNPLYFEDPNLERCGRSKGCFTNLSSAVQFFATVPQLPCLMLKTYPRECVCARPDCPTCHEFTDAP
jgi:hypothetical protein